MLKCDGHDVVAGESVATAVESGWVGRAGEHRGDEAAEGRDIEKEGIIDLAGEEADARCRIGGHHLRWRVAASGGHGRGRENWNTVVSAAASSFTLAICPVVELVRGVKLTVMNASGVASPVSSSPNS